MGEGGGKGRKTSQASAGALTTRLDRPRRRSAETRVFNFIPQTDTVYGKLVAVDDERRRNMSIEVEREGGGRGKKLNQEEGAGRGTMEEQCKCN